MLLPIVNILNDYNICEKLTSYPTTLILLRLDKNLSLDVAIGINESLLLNYLVILWVTPVADNVRITHIKICCAYIVDVCNWTQSGLISEYVFICICLLYMYVY